MRLKPAIVLGLFAVAVFMRSGVAASQPEGGSGLASESTIVIHVGELLAKPSSGKSEKVVTMLVVGDKIVEIVNGHQSPESLGARGAEIVDLTNAFVLPGLIDAHVHMTSTPSKSFQLDRVVYSDAHRAIWGAGNAYQTLMAGFTTVRDTAGYRGDSFDSVFALRDGIAAGVVPGPRMLVSGQGVGSLASQGDFLGYRHEVTDLFESRSMCSGPYDCRDSVRYLVKRGADFIKLVPTGWATGASEQGDQLHMFPDEMDAVVQTAHKFGRKVTAHATGLDGIKAALRAGVDSIEHGRVLDEEAIELLLERDAYLVPTLLVTKSFVRHRDGRVPGSARNVSGDQGPPLNDVARQWFESSRTAYEAGVKFAFGTDSAISPHGRNAEEFVLLVEQLGMTPSEAIATATENGADHVGLGDIIGRLEVGMQADIIAVANDPLNDVSELENVIFVMKSGVVYKRP